MGRRKREVKKIEDKVARKVTFSKRRNGLFKKAKDLAVLCDAQVAAIVFSDTGKLHHGCTTSNSLPQMLERYHEYIETEQRASSSAVENQGQNSKYAGFLTTKELLQIVERDHEEPLINQSVNDLQHLENQLQHALIQTRSTKSNLLLDSISNLQEKEKSLEEEKVLLMTNEQVSRNKEPPKRRIKLAIDLNAPANDGTSNAIDLNTSAAGETNNAIDLNATANDQETSNAVEKSNAQ